MHLFWSELSVGGTTYTLHLAWWDWRKDVLKSILDERRFQGEAREAIVRNRKAGRGRIEQSERWREQELLFPSGVLRAFSLREWSSLIFSLYTVCVAIILAFAQISKRKTGWTVRLKSSFAALCVFINAYSGKECAWNFWTGLLTKWGNMAAGVSVVVVRKVRDEAAIVQILALDAKR